MTGIFFCRIVLNVLYRFTYPFLPEIARGLGISFDRAGILIALRALTGLTSVFWGYLGGRYGHRFILIISLLTGLAGAAICGFLPFFPAFVIGFIVIGISKAGYDPVVQTYVSKKVDSKVRAKALGFIELSWASSWFLGIPLTGWLIVKYGWQSPFAAFSILIVLAIAITMITGNKNNIKKSSIKKDRNFFKVSMELLGNSKVRSILFVSFFLTLANENYLVCYGAWLETSFNIKIMLLGMISIIVGLSEFAAEAGVTLFVDRIGKYKSILTGLIITTLLYFLTPVCDQKLFYALIWVSCAAVFHEFTIVSSFPFVFSIPDKNKGIMMAMNFMALTLGRLVGSLTGPKIWLVNERIHEVTFVSGILVLVAVLIFYFNFTKKKYIIK